MTFHTGAVLYEPPLSERGGTNKKPHRFHDRREELANNVLRALYISKISYIPVLSRIPIPPAAPHHEAVLLQVVCIVCSARRPYFVTENIRQLLRNHNKMAAPVEERISVPIDDPNADTEW